METALYYTLSTVSQTLAGALGMLAAFLALRVSVVDASIRAGLDELHKRTGALDLGKGGSTHEAVEKWREWIAQPHGALAATIRDAFDRASWNQRLRDALLRGARRAFVTSAGVMAACFVGLAAAPWLGCSAWRGVPVFVLAIAGGVVCLVWYGRIVGAALK